MKVLLVDDDPDLREVLSDILKMKGFESIPAETGAAALAQIKQQDIDVALIDLKLEDMSGLEVLRGIKERSSDTECILLTGYSSQATAIEAINLGAYSYFLKPYDMEQLMVAIRRAGERRASERALTANEARLSSIFRVAPIGIGVVHEHTFQQVNARLCEMTGYTPEELIGQSARMFYPDDEEFERVGRENYEQIHEKGSGAIETRWKRKDGRIIDILLASTPLIAGDISAGVTFTALDITERQRVEEALRESKKEYQVMTEISPVGVFKTDAQGNTTYVNPRWSQISGLSAEEALGDGWLRAVPLEEREETGANWKKAVGAQIASMAEYRFVRPDGSIVWVLGQAIPERNTKNQMVGYVGTITDITELKKTQKELADSDAELRALLQISLALTDLDLETTLQTIGKRASALFEADACRIFLTEVTDSESLRCVLALGENQAALLGLQVKFNEGVTGNVAARGQAEIVNDMRNDPRSIQITGTPDEEESIMFAPLKSGERVIGVMSVKRLGQERPFSPSDLELLKAFASMSASSVSNARLFELTRQRVVEMEMLYDSGLALSQLLSPKEIGQKIIELLEQKMDWHHTAIRLYQPQNETLELLAFNQPGLKDETERRQAEERLNALISKDSDGLSGWAVRNSRIVRSSDLSHDPHYADTFPGLLSGLYVPMKLGDRVIGVISIESEKPNAFREADEHLVATLANQASSALENARLFNETRQRVTELETLNRVSIALRGITSQNEMLAVVLEETLNALNASDGSISLWNKENDGLHPTIAHGWPSGLNEAPVQPGEGIFGNVFASGEAHFSKEFTSDPLTLPKSRGLLPPGWGGACIPIRSPEQVLGILLVSVPSEREFSQNEVRLLNTLAEISGTALHRMSLHVETERRAQEFKSLYDTSQALSTENELDTLIKTIVEHACALLAAESSGIYLYDEERGDLEVVIDTAYHLTIGTRLQLGEGMAGRVAQTRQPLRVENYSAWEGRSPKYDSSLTRAVLEVPMLYGGELIGVLIANEMVNSKRVFTDADERLLALFASQAAGAIHSARLHQEMMHHLNRLQALHIVDQAIAGSLDKRVTLSILLDQIVAQLEVDAADVLLLHAPLQTLQFAAGQGFHTGLNESASMRLGESFAGRAVLERRIVRVEDLKKAEENRSFALLWSNEDFSNYYAIPLIAKGQVKGVLEVFHRAPFTANPGWLNFLETLANHTAIAVDSAQMFENLQSANMELSLAYDATIEGWSHAMDLRDKETEGHTQRVTETAVTLAGAMGMQAEELLHIRRGALLHDIGKMGVPDHILFKPGKLTEEEWAVMHKHPQLAYEMLQPIQYLRESLDIPHCHHEKWDGTGYPQGLKSEQIPLAARIFAAVDVFDALTSDRPYRKAWTKAKALKYIREHSGTHFDPQVVEKFMEIVGRKKG